MLKIMCKSYQKFLLFVLFSAIWAQKSFVSISIISNSFLTQGSFSSMSIKKSAHFRVNFKEESETFEYPSFEFVLKEMGIDPHTDPDYQMVPFEGQQETLSFDSFLPGGGNSLSPQSSPRSEFYDSQMNFYGRSDSSDNTFDDINATKFTKGKLSGFEGFIFLSVFSFNSE